LLDRRDGQISYLMGFIAIGRVLRRRGVPLPVIGDIERESYKAQLLTVPEAERLASGRQFMSPENQALLREQAAISHAEEYSEDFVYDFVEPGPGDNFGFGIDYTEIKKSCRIFPGLILRLTQHAAFVWNGRKRWPAVKGEIGFALSKTTALKARGQPGAHGIAKTAGRPLRPSAGRCPQHRCSAAC
jgi:hypothetical protein